MNNIHKCELQKIVCYQGRHCVDGNTSMD